MRPSYRSMISVLVLAVLLAPPALRSLVLFDDLFGGTHRRLERHPFQHWSFSPPVTDGRNFGGWIQYRNLKRNGGSIDWYGSRMRFASFAIPKSTIQLRERGLSEDSFGAFSDDAFAEFDRRMEAGCGPGEESQSDLSDAEQETSVPSRRTRTTGEKSIRSGSSGACGAIEVTLTYNTIVVDTSRAPCDRLVLNFNHDPGWQADRGEVLSQDGLLGRSLSTRGTARRRCPRAVGLDAPAATSGRL